MWVRGLKYVFFSTLSSATGVAPHVGAWIEIYPCSRNHRQPESHPMWVRGLKCDGWSLAEARASRTPCGCVD